VKYISDNGISRAIVFTRTKHGADKVARYLEKSGIRAAALHGNKTQGQRKRAMAAFTSQKPPILVATDVAARGLDIDNVSHVVNYDLPNVPESYVHRIGRTGRAGASGFAVSFCDPEERSYLRDIERLTKQAIRAVGGHVGAPAAGTHAAGSHEQREPRAERPQQERREHQPQQRHQRDDRRGPQQRHPAAAGHRPHESRPNQHRSGAQGHGGPQNAHPQPQSSGHRPAQPAVAAGGHRHPAPTGGGGAAAGHPFGGQRRQGGGGFKRAGGRGKTKPWAGPLRHRKANRPQVAK